MRVVGWLPLKEHSSRLPGKNWRHLGGHPLFWHITRTLLDCGALDQVIVNVDGDAAAEKVEAEFGSEVRIVTRPHALRTATASTVELFLDDMAHHVDAALWCLTHATSPLLKAETLRRAVKWYRTEGQYRYDSVISVTPLRERLYDPLGRAVNHNVHVQLPLQELPPLYVENNAFFLIRQDAALRLHNRVGMRPYLWELDEREAIDIDDALDFQVAELLYGQAAR